MYISRFYDRSKVGLLLGILLIWVWDLNRSHWWWYLYSLKHGLRTHDGSISNSMWPKSYHNPEYLFIWSRLKASLLKKKILINAKSWTRDSQRWNCSAEIPSQSTPNGTQFIWPICAISQNTNYGHPMKA